MLYLDFTYVVNWKMICFLKIIYHYLLKIEFSFLFQRNVETYESNHTHTVTPIIAESTGLAIWERQRQLVALRVQDTYHTEAVWRTPNVRMYAPRHSIKRGHATPEWYSTSRTNLSSTWPVLVGSKCPALQEPSSTLTHASALCMIRSYQENVRQ